MGKRYALIIANFEYDNIKDLKAPKYDAEKLEEVLSNPELGDFECELLINKASSEVLEAIEEFYDGRENDDVLLILFWSWYKGQERNLYLIFKKTAEGYSKRL